MELKKHMWTALHSLKTKALCDSDEDCDSAANAVDHEGRVNVLERGWFVSRVAVVCTRGRTWFVPQFHMLGNASLPHAQQPTVNFTNNLSNVVTETDKATPPCVIPYEETSGSWHRSSSSQWREAWSKWAHNAPFHPAWALSGDWRGNCRSGRRPCWTSSRGSSRLRRVQRSHREGHDDHRNPTWDDPETWSSSGTAKRLGPVPGDHFAHFCSGGMLQRGQPRSKLGQCHNHFVVLKQLKRT